MTRLQSIIDGLENKKIQQDNDNYSDVLRDYGYSQYKSGTRAPGFDVKASELKQFFKKTPKPKIPKP